MVFYLATKLLKYESSPVVAWYKLLILLGGAVLVFREMRIANPVVNFRPLGDRNKPRR